MNANQVAVVNLDHFLPMTENKNPFQDWWDSDACKELQKSHREAKERAVGKYFMLSEEDKLDMVQAICYIMCKAESEGVSHRGLMDKNQREIPDEWFPRPPPLRC